MKCRSHVGERRDHATHRAARQRGVANEGCRNRVPGDETHDEPCAGSRIAEIERLIGFPEAADPDALHRPRTIGMALDNTIGKTFDMIDGKTPMLEALESL